jgi:hypothetical protein
MAAPGAVAVRSRVATAWWAKGLAALGRTPRIGPAARRAAAGIARPARGGRAPSGPVPCDARRGHGLCSRGCGRPGSPRPGSGGWLGASSGSAMALSPLGPRALAQPPPRAGPRSSRTRWSGRPARSDAALALLAPGARSMSAPTRASGWRETRGRATPFSGVWGRLRVLRASKGSALRGGRRPRPGPRSSVSCRRR